nr:hypothetical protein [Candidatus Freyrarchaeum guaymaensis]
MSSSFLVVYSMKQAISTSEDATSTLMQDERILDLMQYNIEIISDGGSGFAKTTLIIWVE